MADLDTAIKGDSAVTASPDASEASSKAGSESSQPIKTEVGTETVEDKGNSAASDGQDGADSEDGVRQRPGRAERKIGELTKQIKEMETQLAQKDSLATKLTATPVDASQVNLPDYSQMSEVTPDQLKKDIINAASQIVDLKMQTTANVLEQKLTQKDASEKSALAIESAINKYPVLNPNDEDNYDGDLDKEISDAYAEVLKKDPTYPFSKFIKPMERFLESNTTSKDTTTKESNRGRSANRAGAQSRGQKPFDEMNTTEMEAWFAAKRGR